MGRFEPRSLALLYAAGLLLCSLNTDPVTSAPRHQVRCDGCGQSTSGYEIVNYGSIEMGIPAALQPMLQYRNRESRWDSSTPASKPCVHPRLRSVFSETLMRRACPNGQPKKSRHITPCGPMEISGPPSQGVFDKEIRTKPLLAKAPLV